MNREVISGRKFEALGERYFGFGETGGGKRTICFRLAVFWGERKEIFWVRVPLYCGKGEWCRGGGKEKKDVAGAAAGESGQEGTGSRTAFKA